MELAKRLRAGETILTAWSGIPDALTVEAVSNLGFEAVTLDMQHGGHHEDSVLRGIQPIRQAEKVAVVRVPVGRFDMVSRALDFGAEAIIAPMINTLSDAKAFAAAAKYPPMGERSWGPTFGFPRLRAKDQNQWLKEMNDKTVAFAMIETRAALDILDDILNVDGVGAIFVGPSDFSIAWTNGEKLDASLEDMMDAVADIGRRVVKAGKIAGIFAMDPKLTGRFHGMGYRFFALGNEQRYMAIGAETMIKQARDSLA